MENVSSFTRKVWIDLETTIFSAAEFFFYQGSLVTVTEAQYTAINKTLQHASGI